VHVLTLLDDTIFECLQCLDEVDAVSMGRKLRSNARDYDNRKFFHAFRELILGSYLARHGFRVRAHLDYDGQDPDWSVLGGQGELNALIEMTISHADDNPTAAPVIFVARQGAVVSS
jgi:hypothetical protein